MANDVANLAGNVSQYAAGALAKIHLKANAPTLSTTPVMQQDNISKKRQPKKQQPINVSYYVNQH